MSVSAPIAADHAQPAVTWRARMLAAGVGASWTAMGVFPGDMGPNLLAGLSRRSSWLTRERVTKGTERAATGLGLARPEAEAIVRACLGHISRNALEMRVFRRHTDQGDDSRWSIQGAEHLDQALASGRGVLLSAGHFGAWELLAEMVARRFQPTWILSHPRRNPKLEEHVVRLRSGSIAGTIDKHDMRSLFRTLKAGGLVTGLFDQRGGRGGWRLPFLGMDASHHRAPGVLARRCNVLCLPIAVVRDLRGRQVHYRLSIQPAVEADPALTGERAEVDVVRRLSAALERTVRADPEQYLWTHDRWSKAASAMTPPDAPEAE